MDINAWDRAIDAFYARDFTEADPAGTVAAMRELLDTMAADDAGALVAFELAGVHDSLGLEVEAVPLYREALASGLDADHASQARIQLASTLRNLGQFDEAVELLSVPAEGDLEPARKAFLALTLHSAGRADEALREAIEGIVPCLPRYQRSLASYAAALTDPK
ncbi:tetratricopeptide repeat protein [Demequina sp. TTPB684]|uniref:tetratricopeptide repeat protein n=1 Tax=unclassified Demequina TaxID=2620311 RepID=UPI001CF358CD|nr:MULTISPECIES: tetratricopeptide repeat protein [unclassified Demequina]MCB2411729.1 tetratricopeptide repeat protein [Demequina sp. TTPB684]UPU87627.1 tetratricopeptide repeat protein [Demequina sp. TMPB413]